MLPWSILRLSIFFSTFLSSMPHKKKKRAQKVINYFDRFNYKFAKWNRKRFIRQSRCRMFVIRPSPKWWWWWWILSDAHPFLLSSCHFLRLPLAINIVSKDSEKQRQLQWTMFYSHSWHVFIYGDILNHSTGFSFAVCFWSFCGCFMKETSKWKRNLQK